MSLTYISTKNRPKPHVLLQADRRVLFYERRRQAYRIARAANRACLLANPNDNTADNSALYAEYRRLVRSCDELNEQMLMEGRKLLFSIIREAFKDFGLPSCKTRYEARRKLRLKNCERLAFSARALTIPYRRENHGTRQSPNQAQK